MPNVSSSASVCYESLSQEMFLSKSVQPMLGLYFLQHSTLIFSRKKILRISKYNIADFMDAIQFSFIHWLTNELENYVIASRNVEEDEMSLNYAIRDIVMDHGHNFHNTGIDVYRGRSYNTDFAILSSSTSDGLIQFRTVPARKGDFTKKC